MRIFTNLNGEKKEISDVEPPEVYTDDVPDLLIKKKTIDDDYIELPHQPAAVIIQRRKRNRNLLQLCLLLTALFVLALGVMTGIYLYRYFTREKVYRGWCGVRDNDFEFYEDIETDAQKYEKIDVPAIRDFRKATVLHDFEMNYTAIVDKEGWSCYVIPLNHSLVKPPKDFWDLISKLQSGYYLPDEEMVKENYRVLQPPVYDLAPYGYFIYKECKRFSTYRMQRIDMEPMAMVKREACPQERYLGASGKVISNWNIFKC